MTADLWYLVASVILCWIMLLAGSTLRVRSWTARGFLLGFGNRDDVPAPSPLSRRADRAAANMLENLVLFVALLFTARAAGAEASRLELGAALFFWARLLYFPVYLIGIPYLRTALWAVAVAGVAVLVLGLF